jgi:hypothetical protein
MITSDWRAEYLAQPRDASFLNAFRQDQIRPLHEGTREPMIEALLPLSTTRALPACASVAQQAGFSGLLVEV